MAGEDFEGRGGLVRRLVGEAGDATETVFGAVAEAVAIGVGVRAGDGVVGGVMELKQSCLQAA